MEPKKKGSKVIGWEKGLGGEWTQVKPPCHGLLNGTKECFSGWPWLGLASLETKLPPGREEPPVYRFVQLQNSRHQEHLVFV